MNNGEQVLDRPLRGLGARRAAGDCGPYHGVGTAGRRALRPLPWGLARRAAGDCGPYRWGWRGGPQGTAAPTVGRWGRNVRERNINELEQAKYGE